MMFRYTMLTFIFKKIPSKVISRNVFSTARKFKQPVDPIQKELLEDKCFLIDERDNVIGHATKKHCHIVQPNGHIPLHRGFSVFLFNEKGDLLLHKRSDKKVSYPGTYTNSCCSHPLENIPGEDEDLNALGIKRAARRRLNYELGIPLQQIDLEKIHFITKFYYKDKGDGKWGEHEIGYLLFLQDNLKVKPNPTEINEIIYVPRKELDTFFHTFNKPLTPWFHMLLKQRLRFWWDNLHNLEEIKDQKNILKLKL